ncbi:phage tail protein [Acinetobacter bereziniae]|uniref:phage tail protein n=1 Tax=Acinetobacter bereziniae TaxID=106648 RepID=UPI002252A225|nr:phage tail protein [Acinetobacter bereziniae]
MLGGQRPGAGFTIDKRHSVSSGASSDQRGGDTYYITIQPGGQRHRRPETHAQPTAGERERNKAARLRAACRTGSNHLMLSSDVRLQHALAGLQEFQRQTEWRHASSSRIGAQPPRQFVGRGDDAITLPACCCRSWPAAR